MSELMVELPSSKNDDKYLTTKKKYPMNDLGSVYTHYNPKTGKNEPTENKITTINDNGGTE